MAHRIDREQLLKNAESIGYKKYTLGKEITPEQKAFFDRNGFIHFRGFLSPAEVEEIKNQLAEMDQRIVAEKRTIVNGIPIKFGVDEFGKTIVQRMPFTSKFCSAVHQVINSERMKPIIGLIENGRLGEFEKDGVVFSHYVNTLDSKYKTLGWHTDSLREVAYLEKIRPMLNVGIHLDPNPLTNGGLRLIPGTHTQNLFSFFFKKLYFFDTDADPREVPVETEPGDLTVHDGRMWHRVESSPVKGTNSHRRVMYFPVLCGPYKPKTENSPTPYYFRLMAGIKHFKGLKFGKV
jgi:ectoine hydroxylase-related dioxygenase (phytanoyl-CoA dioxygenase family)